MNVLQNLINRDLIITDCKIKDKKDVISKISEISFSKGYIRNKQFFLKEILDRENEISTEISQGIGMPHIKSDNITKNFMAIIISKKGINYGGFHHKVNIMFCVGVNKDNKAYLNIIAKIARFLSKENVKKSLLNADVPDDVIKLITDFEKVEINIDKIKKQKYFATIIINNVDNFDKVMELSIEIGLKNPTIIDSIYGIRKMFFNIPFLSSFLLSGNKNTSSKILVGVTEDKEYARILAGNLKNEGIDLEKEGQGIILLQKLEDMIGGNDEVIDI